MDKNAITVETTVDAPITKVWEYWSQPSHIVQWAFASDTWEAPSAVNDLRVGGKFTTIMAAKDKSERFDFTGIYSVVKEHECVEYDLEDGRHVKIVFAEVPEGVKITETFDLEHENPLEMQRSGWQAIMDNFKRYAEKASNN